jgi:hypothetical protein
MPWWYNNHMSPNSVQFTPPIDSIPPLSDGVLLVFYAIAIIYLIFTGVLYYHWQQYSTDIKMNWITGIAYIATTLPLMLIMSILALTI